MSKTRIKIALKHISTRDEAESVMNELALAMNNKRKLQAQLDAEILKAKQSYETALASLDAKIANDTDALRAWAESAPEEFPKGRKSIELLAGVLGFRTGTPKLALLNRSWNWEKVLEAAMVYLPNFIRKKPELDKEAIITQRDELQPVFHRVGIKVVQGESFYVEPKLTEVETRQTVEA